LDEIKDLDNPLYNLTLACAQEFLNRLPAVAIPLLHGLAIKLIKSNHIP
jgi:hypothetical protein